jgi:hypothetical protein
LPKLNLWNVAGLLGNAAGGVGGVIGGAMGGPTGIAGGVIGAVGSVLSAASMAEDIAPFLVPANWFRAKEAGLLYTAEQEGYRALWSNELMTGKSLYMHLLLDRSLLAHIEQSRKELDDILTIVQMRELLGGAPQGASRDIEVRMLALKEDKRSLEVLVEEEESLLVYMMAFPADMKFVFGALEMPDFSSFEPLDYSDFEFRATDTAPELRQFDSLISIADYIQKEVLFSFLGASSASRGVAGGVFDGMPTQSGLGFGTPSSMRVVRAQKELLKVQRKGVEETIKRQLRLLVSNYNLDLENYGNLKRREELTRQILEEQFERLRLGQNVETLDMIEASRNHIQADTAFFAVQFRFLANEDRLARLIFYGDYTKRPVNIESLDSDRSSQ